MTKIKTVFIDYTGTTVQEGGREMQELVARVCHNSDLHEPKAAVALWWKLLKQYEEGSCGDGYLTEDEIVDRVLLDLEHEYHLHENLDELHELIRGFWTNAPLFPDAAAFYERCPVPVYVITNNGIQYVGKGLKAKGISPAGIIYADMVRAYKPHRELFEKALEVSGCEACETVHIGDSYVADAQGALAAGIRPILIQRAGGQAREDVTVIRSLPEALDYI